MIHFRRSIGFCAFISILSAATLYAQTFSQWAASVGLPVNATYADAMNRQITSLDGVKTYSRLQSLYLNDNTIGTISTSSFSTLTSLQTLLLANCQINTIQSGGFFGLNNLQSLYLTSNNLTRIKKGDFAGLTKMTWLDLYNNRITQIETGSFSQAGTMQWLCFDSNPMTTLNLAESTFYSLTSISSNNTPIDKVILNSANLNYCSFYTMISYYTGYRLKELSMNNVNFTDILTNPDPDSPAGPYASLNYMYAMDDLLNLSLADASNLPGQEVVRLVNQLSSLEYLNVAGIWEQWDGSTKNSLLAWDAMEGHTLVVPEPVSLLLLSLGVLILRPGRK